MTADFVLDLDIDAEPSPGSFRIPRLASYMSSFSIDDTTDDPQESLPLTVVRLYDDMDPLLFRSRDGFWPGLGLKSGIGPLLSWTGGSP